MLRLSREIGTRRKKWRRVSAFKEIGEKKLERERLGNFGTMGEKFRVFSVRIKELAPPIYRYFGTYC